jgi:hypothetical protein
MRVVASLVGVAMTVAVTRVVGTLIALVTVGVGAAAEVEAAHRGAALLTLDTIHSVASSV